MHLRRPSLGGNRSRQRLAAQCFKKSAAAIPQTTDRYGRTAIKIELIREARITLDNPGGLVAGVMALSTDDLVAEKLMANSDRWPDESMHGRGIIDLGMMLPAARFRRRCAKGLAMPRWHHPRNPSRRDMKTATLLAALLCCTASYGQSVRCLDVGGMLSCGSTDGSRYNINKVGDQISIDRYSPPPTPERRFEVFPTAEDVRRTGAPLREVRIVPQDNGKSCVFVMAGRQAVPFGCE